MFFFFEQLFIKYQEAMDRWEKNGEKWVEKGQLDGYSWRTIRDYERQYPSPKDRFFKTIKGIFLIIGGIVAVGFFLLVLNNSITTENESREKAYAGHTCKAHELNDRVKIQYGTFEGSIGTIVGGCGHTEDYQVKLESRMFDVPDDGIREPVDLKDKVIKVDSYRNLVKIEEE